MSPFSSPRNQSHAALARLKITLGGNPAPQRGHYVGLVKHHRLFLYVLARFKDVLGQVREQAREVHVLALHVHHLTHGDSGAAMPSCAARSAAQRATPSLRLGW